MLIDTFLDIYICFHLFNLLRKLNSSLEIPVIKSKRSKMFELISYEKFRDTKDVRFFDISVNQSNYRDLVIHSGPAVSPPNDEDFKNWQFYIHPVSYTHLTLPTKAHV